MALSPLGFAPSLLLLMLPFIWLLGRRMAERITDDRALCLLLTPAIGVTSWILSVHLIGRATSSFVAGLYGGTILTALVGGLLWRALPAVLPRSAPSRAMLIGALAAMFLIAPMTIGFGFHDEQLLTGHLSIAAQMQNGHYPPRHMTFPGLELRYHYGFNILVALVASLTHLRIDHCIDVVTLISFGYTFCLLFSLGIRLGLKVPVFVPIIVLLGIGMPYLGQPQEAPFVHRLLGLGTIDSLPLNPPMLSYFFQHPWTLGLPLGIALLLLLGQTSSLSRWIALVILLATLALTQIVLFASLLVVSVAVLVQQRAAKGAVAMAAALLIAYLSGGFFLPSYGESELLFSLGRVSLLWQGLSFGLLLPLGVWGFVIVRQQRLALVTLALLSLVLLNTVSYLHSADAIKLANVAALALAIGSAVTLSRCFALGQRALAGILAVLVGSGGVVFSLVFTCDLLTGVSEIPKRAIFHEATAPPPSPDAEAIAWLRERVQPGDLVYRRDGLPYGQWGGLPQAIGGAHAQKFGFPEERIQQRLEVLRSADPTRFAAEGIRWIVLDEQEVALREEVARWVRAGLAEEASRQGTLQIYHLNRMK